MAASMLVSEIAEWLGVAYEGDANVRIERAAPLESAKGNEIAFVNSRKAIREASKSHAGCLIVGRDFADANGRTLIRAKDPRGAFAKVLRRFHPIGTPAPGIHRSSVMGENCSIASDVHIGPHCTIGDGVAIGPGSLLHGRTTIYSGVRIGARAVIHAGAVIGADGFGFVFENGHYEKFPQVGQVVIGDDVEIGANTCIDRAALGVTSIGDGTKLDNLVHIGHNCRIGRHVVIAAQTGIAGGSTIEDYAVIGGQVGIGDNVTIKSRAIVGSGAGILTSKILKGDGEVYWGTPARPLKEYLEMLANQAKLPEIRRELAEIKLLLQKRS